MKKGAISLVGSMLMLLGGVSGCGSATNEKEIVFWHCLGHDKMRAFTRIVDKFNEEHEKTDGYVIKPEKLAGAYDDLHDAVKTKLQAGTVPSITMGYPDSFSEYIGSKGEENSQILKLDGFITEDGDAFKKEEFVPAYYNEGTSYQYSGTWSMPLYKSTEVMYVNNQLFEGTDFYKTYKDETYGDYGAKIGNPATWDWDTLVYVAKECQNELGSKPDFHALGYDSDANLFISQMAMRNIPYTTAEGTGAEHFLFCENGVPNADLVNFAAQVLDLTDTGALVTQGSYGNFASELFMQKKALITIGSTGGSSYNDPHGSTDAGFDCGLYSVPCYKGKENAKYIMQGPSLCFFNTRNPKKEKAAWEFYSKFVADPELNAALALENSYDPVKVSSYQTDIYKETIAKGKTAEGDDNVKESLQYRIPNLTATMKDNYITSPVFNGSAKARSEIGAILKYAKTQKAQLKSPEKVTAAIIKIFNNCVNYIRGTGK